MFRVLIASIVLFSASALCSPVNADWERGEEYYPEIHCKHFIYGCPWGLDERFACNDLIIRDIYALWNNDETKFADWVAYHLTPEITQGDARTSRKWAKDPWLDDDETLCPEHYRGAHDTLHTDRGHQAPLGSFMGTSCWAETNYLSNITPQQSSLNQGAWLQLEQAVRDLVMLTGEVYIYTGTLYEHENQPLHLPECDSCVVPTGYWKIVLVPNPGEDYPVQAAAFLFDQDTERPATTEDVDKEWFYLTRSVSIDEIEDRTGLDFLHYLDDGIEAEIEYEVNCNWYWHFDCEEGACNQPG